MISVSFLIDITNNGLITELLSLILLCLDLLLANFEKVLFHLVLNFVLLRNAMIPIGDRGLQFVLLS